MKNVQFLIKYGENDFMQRLVDGYFYFSNAVRFRDLEMLLMKKGQGDYLEGGSKIHGTNMEMYDNDTGELVAKIPNMNATAHYKPADNIPLFCWFICFQTDCEKTSDNTYRLTLKNDIINDIKSHFDKADTAAIIINPLQFIEDINNAFNGKAKAEKVHYFNIEGIPTADGRIAQDMDYHKYLTQDTPPKKVNGKTQYSFNVEYVFRCLFCKDIFFANEQEFRILLPEENILMPKEFFIPISTPIKLYNMVDILNGVEFEI